MWGCEAVGTGRSAFQNGSSRLSPYTYSEHSRWERPWTRQSGIRPRTPDDRSAATFVLAFPVLHPAVERATRGYVRMLLGLMAGIRLPRERIS